MSNKNKKNKVILDSEDELENQNNNGLELNEEQDQNNQVQQNEDQNEPKTRKTRKDKGKKRGESKIVGDLRKKRNFVDLTKPEASGNDDFEKEKEAYKTLREAGRDYEFNYSKQVNKIGDLGDFEIKSIQNNYKTFYIDGVEYPTDEDDFYELPATIENVFAEDHQGHQYLLNLEDGKCKKIGI